LLGTSRLRRRERRRGPAPGIGTALATPWLSATRPSWGGAIGVGGVAIPILNFDS